MADMKAISGLEGCVGAIDGCFIGMKGCGGDWQHQFWCYKDLNRSIILTLLAIVDAEYRFMYVDVGKGGGVGDSQCFHDTGCHPIMRVLKGSPSA
eukprot:237758-Chlamydomonas_euryale.AAC.1